MGRNRRLSVASRKSFWAENSASGMTVTYSFVLTVLFIVLWFSTYLETIYPGWSQGVVWLTALLTGTAFLLSLMIHGLVQARVLRLQGKNAAQFVLLPSGSVVLGSGEPPDSKIDLWVGLSGLLVHGTFAVGAMSLASYWYASPARIPPTPQAVGLVWFGYFNLLLGFLNLLPGAPFDGGRILHAAVWRRTREDLWTEQVIAKIGHLLALLILIAAIIWLSIGRIVYGICLLLVAGGLVEFWLRANVTSILRTSAEENERP